VRLTWSNPALDELENIFNYISLYSPLSAARVRKEIMYSARKLIDFPDIGRAAERKGTRLLVVPGLPYLLAYQITKDEIKIGSVIDGRMKRSPDLL
jgi:toxin ParE1/3/4